MEPDYTDTDRLDFMIEWGAYVASTGTIHLVRDRFGSIVGEDMTPRDALDNAMHNKGYRWPPPATAKSKKGRKPESTKA